MFKLELRRTADAGLPVVVPLLAVQSVCVLTRLFVDRPHIQLEGTDGETPQHLGVHDLRGRKLKRETNDDLNLVTDPLAATLVYLSTFFCKSCSPSV